MTTSKVLIFLIVVAVITLSQNFIYGDKMNEQEIILPTPDTAGKVTLETAISNRRSVRAYSDKKLNMKQIGQLLWAAQGITDKRGHRTAPSAGALYPLELYVAKDDGLYHYIPKGHRLRRITDNDLRPELQAASLSQPSVGEAAINIIICAVYNRIASKYGARGTRYTDIEVGHAAQNIHLEAVALGLASVPIGAFGDNEVAKVLSLPEAETPIYIIPVGYAKD